MERKKCENCSHMSTSMYGEIYCCLDYEMNSGDYAEQCKVYDDNRSCMNCANRIYEDWGGSKPCLQWEQLETREQEKEMAQRCERYYREEEDDEEYTPSATHGDYGPSHPWDAPGMSMSDFF